MHFAYKTIGTRNVIIFDGASGGINASFALIDFLRNHCREIPEEIERDLLPKWLRQRGIGLPERAASV